MAVVTVVGVVGGGSRWIVGAGACGEEALDGKELRVASVGWEVRVWDRVWGGGKEGLADFVEGFMCSTLKRGLWEVIIGEVKARASSEVCCGGEVGE